MQRPIPSRTGASIWPGSSSLRLIGLGLGLAVALVGAESGDTALRADGSFAEVPFTDLTMYRLWALLVGLSAAYMAAAFAIALAWLRGMELEWRPLLRIAALPLAGILLLFLAIFGAFSALDLAMVTPLPAQEVRFFLIQVVGLALQAPAVLGLFAIQARASRGKSDDLTGLEATRTLGYRFTLLLAISLALGVLTTGAARSAAVAFDPAANPSSSEILLVWGGIFTALLFVIAVPPYLQVERWAGRVVERLHSLDGAVSAVAQLEVLTARRSVARDLGIDRSPGRTLSAVLLGVLPFLSSLAAVFATSS